MYKLRPCQQTAGSSVLRSPRAEVVAAVMSRLFFGKSRSLPVLHWMEPRENRSLGLGPVRRLAGAEDLSFPLSPKSEHGLKVLFGGFKNCSLRVYHQESKANRQKAYGEVIFSIQRENELEQLPLLHVNIRSAWLDFYRVSLTLPDSIACLPFCPFECPSFCMSNQP